MAVSGIVIRSMEYAKDIVPIQEAMADEPIVEQIITESTMPVRISIPSIGVDAEIVPMGVTKTGILDTPNNYVQTGWWAGGTVPGQLGSAVIDAHVDNGKDIPGVFKRLRDLNPGEEAVIAMDDGSKRRFRVVGSEVYNYKNVDTQKLFHESGGRYIKLITCHGNWIPAENTYDERLVVTAVLI